MTKLPEDELRTVQGICDRRVLELGNKGNVTGLYRHWYEDRGCYYRCIDWNGKDGAFVWDMRHPLSVQHDMGEDLFDVVTNFGFSEHVTEQEAVWRNMHDALEVGGMMAICLPTPPHWESHGYWQPRIDWLERLVEVNEYHLHFLSYWTARKRHTVVGRWFKTQPTFVWPGLKGMHRTKLKFRKEDMHGFHNGVAKRPT